MLPLPPDALRAVILGFVIFGFFGLFYFRKNSFKSKIIYLVLLATLALFVVGSWLSMANVNILTELQTYAKGRPVVVLVKTFSRPYVGGTFQYLEGPYPIEKHSGFTFYSHNGTGWSKLNTECSDCMFRECENGVVKDVFYGSQESECRQLSDRPYVWDQTVYIQKEMECNGEKYTTYAKIPVERGRYRIELCYARAYDFQWDNEICIPYQNIEPQCIETFFTIK